jgi:regulator of protease activity HflC (stomatin/prohibitin superfamily)
MRGERAMPTSFIFLVIFLIILAASTIKVVSESQRLVVYRLGRFFGLKGPGLISVIPAVDKCTKIGIGDQGELMAQDFARIKGVDVPVRVDGSAMIGQSVRIQSFTDKDAVVALDTVQAREFVCQKCGHINRI